MAEKKPISLPYSFETVGDGMFLVGLYKMGGGKTQHLVESPEGLRGLDAIVATIREEERAARVAAASAAHEAHAAGYGGISGQY